MDPKAPEVVIVGGGFGGLNAAKALRGAPVRVTLVDRRNHHLFQPLLYQVATAALNPSDIAVPIRSILRGQDNATVLLAEATGVDLSGKRLVLADGEVPYDSLILASGATHAYFGKDEWEPLAPGLKSIEDALGIRRRILSAFEAAEREPEPDLQSEWLTFVVVGGGPTGVELAGALAEVARHALVKDFRRIDPRKAWIVLVEGTPRVLPTFPEVLSAKARTQLERLGVEVRVGTRVTGIDPRGVNLGEQRLPARTVLWAAGVRASSLAQSLGVPLDRAGRVLVEKDLSIPGHPEVFVIGDLASFAQDGAPIPGIAPAAVQMGRHAAATIRGRLRGESSRAFSYVDRGMLATVGRGAAVGAFRRARLSGYLAWWAWLLVHIFFLIGFRNRLLVLFEWAWAYVTYQRGARLITGDLKDQSANGEG